MSVVVKGMNSFNYCYECPFHTNIYNGFKTERWCKCLNRISSDSEGHKPDDCPIIQLPENHKRLIEEPKEFDLSGLVYIHPDDYMKIAAYFAQQVKSQPTIVDAE